MEKIGQQIDILQKRTPMFDTLFFIIFMCINVVLRHVHKSRAHVSQ